MLFYIDNNNSSIPYCLVLLNLDLTIADATICKVYEYAKDVPYAQKFS